MNATEIEMATRLGLGHTLVLFNDNDYGLLSGNQLAHAGGHVGTESTNPDVERFAVSVGIDGYRPETGAEVETTLETVVPSTEPSLVEITPGESRVMHLS